jgi:hypothetical protein
LIERKILTALAASLSSCARSRRVDARVDWRAVRHALAESIAETSFGAAIPPGVVT